MDYFTTTLKELTDQWATISTDSNEKNGQFVTAYQKFMTDCDLRDSKIADRRASIQGENQEHAQHMEKLGEAYTMAILDGDDKQAAAIKAQIDKIAAQHMANEALIRNLGHAAYSQSLLNEAEAAFDRLGDASMELQTQRREVLDVIDTLLRELNKLHDVVFSAGQWDISDKYNMRMHRRFNHQPAIDE